MYVLKTVNPKIDASVRVCVLSADKAHTHTLALYLSIFLSLSLSLSYTGGGGDSEGEREGERGRGRGRERVHTHLCALHVASVFLHTLPNVSVLALVLPAPLTAT